MSFIGNGISDVNAVGTGTAMPRLQFRLCSTTAKRDKQKSIDETNPDRSLVYQGNAEYTVQKEKGSTPTVASPESPWERIKNIGMPAGYPQSVRPGYRRFFHIAVLNGMIASFSSQLATQSLLSGFFAGSSAGSWMLKDLAPTLLSAAVANYITTYGSRTKLWYIVAAVISQIATVIEFLIPHMMIADHYIYAAICTSLLKGSAGLMFGITRANFLQHYAVSHNLGEVTKKIASIAMVIWTVFGALGLAFARYFPDPTIQFGIVACSAVICSSLTCTAVKPIAFRNLTSVTTPILIEDFFESNFTSISTNVGVAAELGLWGVPRADRKQYFKKISLNPKLAEVEVSRDEWKEAVNYMENATRQLDLDPSSTDQSHHGRDHLPFIIGAWQVRKSSDIEVLGKTLVKRQAKKTEKIVVIFEKDAELVDVIHALLIASAAGFHQQPDDNDDAAGSEDTPVDGGSSASGGAKLKRPPRVELPLKEALEIEMLPHNFQQWRGRAEHFVELLPSAGWDHSLHSIDVAGRRVTFYPQGPAKN